MKKCEFSGCPNDIQVWQKFCPTHQQMMMQQAQQQRQNQMVSEMPPAIPQTRVMMPTEDNQPQKIIMKPIEPRPMTDLKDVRVEAMRFAVDLICETDIEQKPYDQLIGELRTMTNDIEKILLEK
jgi:hypothetical protein